MNSALRLGSTFASRSSLRFALVSLLALGFASGCGRNAQVIGDDMSGVSTAGDSGDSGGGTVDSGGADAVTGSGSTAGSGGATLAEGGVGNAVPLGGSASGGFSTGGDDTQGSGGWSEGGASQGNAEPGGGASQGGVSQGGAEPGGGASQGGATLVGGASSGGATSVDCDCGEGQFCNRESCQADAPGECTDKPEGCLTDVQPVCGCDGKTYSNGCERLRAGVSLDYAGECVPDPCGGCDDGERCVYQLGGPGPSHYTCAPQLPCGSNEECACITGQGTCDVSATDATLCECENGLE